MSWRCGRRGRPLRSRSQPPQPAHAASGERTTAPADPLGPPSTAPSHELDVLHSFGSSGPWAAYRPYAPPPKPPDWIDPEPSRWPSTGAGDPYDHPGRYQPHRCAEGAGRCDRGLDRKNSFSLVPPPAMPFGGSGVAGSRHAGPLRFRSWARSGIPAVAPSSDCWTRSGRWLSSRTNATPVTGQRHAVRQAAATRLLPQRNRA